MRLPLVPAFGFFLAALSANAAPQSSPDAVESALVVSFLDLVSWSDSPAEYTIGVQGSVEMTAMVANVAAMVKGRVIHVRRVERDFTGCQVVFVSAGNPPGMKSGVLTVGQGEAFTSDGGIIGLVIRDGKVRLFVNKAHADRAGLTISPRLLALSSQ